MEHKKYKMTHRDLESVEVIVVIVPIDICDFTWFVPTYSNIIQHYKIEMFSISYKIIFSLFLW